MIKGILGESYLYRRINEEDKNSPSYYRLNDKSSKILYNTTSFLSEVNYGID